MTFYCVNCFAELASDDRACPRCGVEQQLDGRDYPAKLRKALKHPLAETRRRAIFVLGEKRVAEAVRDLAELADHEDDPFLVEEAAIALGKIRNEESLAALAHAAHHKSFSVRARAIEALARAGGAWRKIALDIAEHDPSATVRESVRCRND
ncbi:MAG TPA: HEAT repeat domain-containing protein [Candidatus Binataceae bacterium]|jgi:HEAT repeat protein|nr:HEAT repeat domain-containing protein [Candidatus Binataceae bacterium]